jgi:general secretion pathway protein K
MSGAKKKTRTRPARARQRGVALLLVLWVFMTLGVIALDFGEYMRDDAAAALNVSEETRSYYIALAGLNRALFELLEEQQRNPADVADVTGQEEDIAFPIAPLDGHWHEGTFGDGRFRERITSETGRIPINCGIEDGEVDFRRTMLTTVVTNLLTGGNRVDGVDRRDDKMIRTVVDSILDWTDFDDEHQPNGAESDYYGKLVPPYPAKNNIVNSPEELLGVRGMTAELLYGTADHPGLRDVITVYRVEDDEGECVIDGRHVTAPVLQALGVEAEQAQELIAERESLIGDTADVEIKMATAISPELGGEFVRWDDDGGDMLVSIEVEADLSHPRNRSRVLAVLEADLSEGGGLDEVIVKRWQDRAPWQYDPTETVAPEAEAAG